MPTVKGDGMRGLAVFISDIRNCECFPHFCLSYLLVCSDCFQANPFVRHEVYFISKSIENFLMSFKQFGESPSRHDHILESHAFSYLHFLFCGKKLNNFLKHFFIIFKFKIRLLSHKISFPKFLKGSGPKVYPPLHSDMWCLDKGI